MNLMEMMHPNSYILMPPLNSALSLVYLLSRSEYFAKAPVLIPSETAVSSAGASTFV